MDEAFKINEKYACIHGTTIEFSWVGFSLTFE